MAPRMSRPRPGNGKDLFDHDGAAEQIAGHDADAREERDQRVAQGVLVDDAPLAQALGARGSHIILPKRVEHRRAHEAREVGEDGERQREGRQQHPLEVAERVFGERHIAERREAGREAGRAG